MDLEKNKQRKKNGPGEQIEMFGLAISPGIVIGKAVVAPKTDLNFREDFISIQDINEELQWAKEATFEVISELMEVKISALEDIKPLINAEIMILKDPTFLEKVDKLIKEKRYKADYSIFLVLSEMADSIEQRGESPYMKERATELRVLAKTLAGKIQKIEKNLLMRSKEARIFVSDELSIFEAFKVIESNFKGVILGGGGKTSHTAIIFRNYRIPAVFAVGEEIEHIKNDDLVALDGGKGKIIINPNKDSLSIFKKRIKAYANFMKELMRLKDVAPKTKDGYEINLLANIDFEEEIKILKKFGNYGIGLFRTEIFYLTKRIDEDTQAKIYNEIAESIYPNKVVFRAFDLGGDKVLGVKEGNPFLGLRGIRALLREKKILYSQIKAIFTANRRGNVAFMLPMVSTVEEIKETLKIMKGLQKELYTPMPEFGVMIETPSAALMVKEFSPFIDFISIGTNDLTQFTLAVDRRNPRVSYLYDHLHPSVLKLAYRAVKDAKEIGLKISVCGELASDPMGIPLLIGMGVEELSVTPVVLLETKELIRGISKEESEELLERALKASNTREVRSLSSEFLNKRFPNLVMFHPI